MLVLEHVPAESLLALCETSREFGVLAREVGAARMKHAPRWAARALYGTPAPRCTEVMRSPSESACQLPVHAHAEPACCLMRGMVLSSVAKPLAWRENQSSRRRP